MSRYFNFFSLQIDVIFLILFLGMQRVSNALNIDYIVDEKGRTAVLTKQGIDKTEKYFGSGEYGASVFQEAKSIASFLREEATKWWKESLRGGFLKKRTKN